MIELEKDSLFAPGIIARKIINSDDSLEKKVEKVLSYSELDITFNFMYKEEELENNDFYIKNRNEIKKYARRIIKKRKLTFTEFYNMLMLYSNDFEEPMERFIENLAVAESLNSSNAKILLAYGASSESGVYVENEYTLKRLEHISKL